MTKNESPMQKQQEQLSCRKYLVLQQILAT